MSRDASAPPPAPRSGAQRKWAFVDCTVDEANQLLSIAGEPVTLEAKPFDLLIELLRHAGEVVTKDELLDAVWPGVTVVEGSLTTALSKLCRAIGDGAGQVIVTVPRVGYRLAAPVTVRPSDAETPVLAIVPDMAVPGRLHWRYAERLGQSPHAEVWRIVHDKTRAAHVLKLAADAVRLRALKREVAVARLLREMLGERPDVVPVLDWNFAEAPFFIESPDFQRSSPRRLSVVPARISTRPVSASAEMMPLRSFMSSRRPSVSTIGLNECLLPDIPTERRSRTAAWTSSMTSSSVLGRTISSTVHRWLSAQLLQTARLRPATLMLATIADQVRGQSSKANFVGVPLAFAATSR